MTNEKEVKAQIEAKLSPTGNSYHFLVPKSLVDCKVLEDGKKYTITVVFGIRSLDTDDVQYTSNFYDAIGNIRLKP